MGLELKQFGQTLAVGAFAMLGLWLLLRIFLNLKLKDLKPNGVEGNNVVFSGILLAFLFTIGIVLENISKHIVADRDPPSVFLRTVFGYNLKKDKETRFDVLFEKKANDSCCFFWRTKIDSFKANSFYNRLYCEGYFNNASKCATKLDTAKFNLGDSAHFGQYFDTIEKPYYQNSTNSLNNNAKDRVFLEANYYTELIALTSRMDFLRAFIFLSTALIYLNFFIVIPFIFYKKNIKKEVKFDLNKIALYSLLSIVLLFLLSINFDFIKQLLIVGFVIILILIFYFYKKIPNIDTAKDSKDKTVEEKELEAKELKVIDNDQKTNNVLLFTALCLLLSIVLPTAYEAECSNYNRRVLGYHLALIKKLCEKCTEKSCEKCDGQKVIEPIKSIEPATTITNYYNTQQSSKKNNPKNQNTNAITTNNLGNSNLPCVDAQRKIDSLNKLMKILKQKNRNKK